MGETTINSTPGESIWIRTRTGGAKFTGASASLKVVSGESTRGAADTHTAAPNNSRTNIQRRRITLMGPGFQNYSGKYGLSTSSRRGHSRKSSNRVTAQAPKKQSLPEGSENDEKTKCRLVASASLFGFRNRINFPVRRRGIGERLLATEGTMAPKDCPRCGGTGYVARPADISGKSEGVAFIRVKCPACAGSGRIEPLPPSTAG